MTDTDTASHNGQRPTVAKIGDIEKVPPNDMGAEQSMLGGIMLCSGANRDYAEDAFAKVPHPEYFYRPAHQDIYSVLLYLFKRNDPIDVITAAAELGRRGLLERGGGAGYLHTLISSVPTAANTGYYAAIVAEKGMLRGMVEAGTSMVQAAMGNGDLDTIMDRIDEIYTRATARAEVFSDAEMVEDLAADAFARYMTPVIGFNGLRTGWYDLDRLVQGMRGGQLIVIGARPSVGKALALDTPLPTPTGWTTMANVRVGDLLIGANGKPTRVVAATEVMHNRPCYEVEFSDGSVIVADAGHRWLTETRAARRYAQQGRAYSRIPLGPAVRTTEEIAATVRCGTADRRFNHSIRTADPFILPESDLPIDPYLLGVWLGDGTSAAAQITTSDPEIVAEIESRGYVVKPSRSARYRYTVQLPTEDALDRVCMVCGKSFSNRLPHVRTCGKSCGGRLKAIAGPLAPRACSDCGGPVTSYGPRCQGCRNTNGSVTGRLRTLGVLEDKHIPTAYLRASEQQRRDLLAGLLDTDGTVSNVRGGTGHGVAFEVTNKRLAYHARDLIATLGSRVTVTTKRVCGRTEDSSTCYRVNFTPDSNVFRLSRKVARLSIARSQRSRSRFVVDVRRTKSVPVRCVQVSSPDRLYLAGPTCIPTHNSTAGLDVTRYNARNGIPVYFASLEMSRNEVLDRLFSAELSINLDHLRTGRLADGERERLRLRMPEIALMPIAVDARPNLTVHQIRAAARAMRRRRGLGLVVVYLQELGAPDRKFENRQLEVSENIRGLKQMGREMDIPVVVLFQLNRLVEHRADKRPQLSDGRESGSIEQSADVAILIHREDQVNENCPPEMKNIAEFVVAKNRNGEKGLVKVTAQLYYARFASNAREDADPGKWTPGGVLDMRRGDTG